MTKMFVSAKPLNLHLFDGAAAGGEGAGAAQSGEAQSDVTTTVNAQTETGDNTESDAGTQRQDAVISTDNDLRRTQYNKLIAEYKDLYTKDTQKIIDKRFKETKVLEKNAKTIEPMLRALAQNYGKEITDLEGICEAVMNDQKLYEARAAENGVSVETQMKFDKIEAENLALKAQQEMNEEEEFKNQLLQKWNDEADELKQKVPDFDLDEAFDNDTFYDLVVSGQSIEVAYNVAFPQQYEQRVRAEQEKIVTDNIRSRGMRPKENGVSPQPTGTQRFDVKNMTEAQVRDFANRVMKGERITLK